MAKLKTNNIFLIGPMGAGKSTIGRHLAKAFGFIFFDSDQEIEARTGADISWIFDLEGEEGFRRRETDILDELTQKTRIVLATGGGAVVKPENRAALSARGTVVYLTASLDQQYRRTRYDDKRPMLQTDNVEERLQTLWDQRAPLYEAIADFTFLTDHKSVKIITNEIIESLESQDLGQ